MLTADRKPLPSRRLALALLTALAALVLPSCESGGHFTILGYTTRPNYDPNIKTVRVNIFKNPTYARGLEDEIARALTVEIEKRTPFKVVGPECDADTELSGAITNFSKSVINENPENEVREAQTLLTVEVTWKDLRTGEILSRPATMRPPVVPLVQLQPGEAPPVPRPGAPGELPAPPPVLISSQAGFIPELGQSLATARQTNAQRLAVQIVDMMEKPW